MPTILVIREADEFSRILTANDFSVVNFPLVETKLFADTSDFEAKIKTIENYDGVFLTSRHAADALRRRLLETKKIFRGKVYVLGRRSFDILKTENLDLCFDEAANTALGFLSGIAPEQLRNKRFLFVRGEKSLRVVPDFLKNFGAAIDETIVYQTREITIEKEKIQTLQRKIENDEIAAICFFSPSGAESFLKQFGTYNLHQTVIAAIGKTTADFFARRNIKVDFVSSKSSARSFAVELIKFLVVNSATDFQNQAQIQSDSSENHFL